MSAGNVITAIGVLIGITGLWLAYKYGSHKPRLAYCLEGVVVVDSTRMKDVELAWRGKNVPSVSRSRVTVWNAGSHTVDGNEIVHGYPLRFIFAGDVLLIDNVVSSKPENGVSVSLDPNDPTSVILEFTYLDPRHGTSFEVIHASGSWFAKPDGTLKGTDVALALRPSPKRFPRHGLKIVVVALLASIVGVIISLMQYDSDKTVSITLFISAGMYSLTAAAYIALYLRKPPAALCNNKR